MPLQPETDSALVNKLISFASLSGVDSVYAVNQIKELSTTSIQHELPAIKTMDDAEKLSFDRDVKNHLIITSTFDELLYFQPLFSQKQHSTISIIILDCGSLNTIVQAATKNINKWAIYVAASLNEAQEIMYVSVQNQSVHSHTLILIERMISDKDTDKNQNLEATILSRGLLNVSNDQEPCSVSASVPPIKIFGNASASLALVSTGAGVMTSLSAAELLRPTIDVAVVQANLVSPLPIDQLSPLLRQFRYSTFIAHHSDTIADYFEEQLNVGPLIKLLIEFNKQSSSDLAARQILSLFTYK